MKVNLLYRDKNLERIEIGEIEKNLLKDLGLDIIIEEMSNGEEATKEIVTQVLIQPLTDQSEIIYRQEIVKDALENINLFKVLNKLANDVIESKRRALFWIMNKKPSSVLFSNVRMLEILIDHLLELKRILENPGHVHSQGLKKLIEHTKTTLTQDYVDQLKQLLKTLEFREMMSFSAKLGVANSLSNFVLRLKEHKGSLIKIFSKDRGYSFTIDERDEAGFRALSDIKDRVLVDIAKMVHTATMSVLRFFETLKEETSFYIAANNLYETIKNKGYWICLPEINNDFPQRNVESLYDLSLMLVTNNKIVPNDLYQKGELITFIVGANQGGKTTFLRSLGIAQIMFQSGLFVPAKSFSSHICSDIFTHFKKEEDINLESGKLDDELKRMDTIAKRIKPRALILQNESFASTNEQEGSEIATHILKAFKENNIEVFYVTHMYTLAKAFLKKQGVNYLVVEVDNEGKRTFKVKPGKPQSTSFGKDLFYKVFGDEI